MKRIDAIKNLLVMAFADRRISAEEIQLLMSRCESWGLKESELAQAIDDVLEHKYDLKIPDSKQARVELLGELLRMMAADGKLHDSERELFARAAVLMEVSDHEVNDMITRITDTNL